MKVFAYGSNLDQSDLDRWCDAHQLPRLALEAPTRAFLPDRRLAFGHLSRTRAGGVLDVVDAPGCAVEGALFDVSADTLDVLDRKESSGHVYRRVRRTILTEDGGAAAAFVYEVEPGHRLTHAPPANSYLDVVRRGYATLGIDSAPLEAAARGDDTRGSVSRLFVYGTLKSDECRAHILPSHGATFLENASVAGGYVDLGDHPGLVLVTQRSRVDGEVYRLEERTALFRALDELEEFPGYDAGPWVYRRAIVATLAEDGRSAPAWVYVYDGPRGGNRVVRSGAWRSKDVP